MTVAPGKPPSSFRSATTGRVNIQIESKVSPPFLERKFESEPDEDGARSLVE